MHACQHTSTPPGVRGCSRMWVVQCWLHLPAYFTPWLPGSAHAQQLLLLDCAALVVNSQEMQASTSSTARTSSAAGCAGWGMTGCGCLPPP